MAQARPVVEELQTVPLKPRRHESRLIGGVRVLFPVKPYPSQLSMMDKIITGLKKGQNCLLESPTGSGKSLALLCSTLAWQREQIEKARKYNDLLENGIMDPDILARAAGLPYQPTRNVSATPQGPSTPVPPSTAASSRQPVDSGGGFFYEDDDDFRSQPPPVRQPEMSDAAPMEVDFEDMDFPEIPEMPRKLRVPKIFLGTRTHKQVEQIVRELRSTAYSDVNMAVLSSREHTCIHPVVSMMPNKNEKCRELNDPNKGTVCGFSPGVNRIKTHDLLAKNTGLQGAWDIEDLVRVGHKVKACPYFAARHLSTSADLVICPYNYLVDPVIREKMNISLKNHVVVFDEAHNIEDSAREAASCTLTQELLLEASKHLRERQTCLEECEKLVTMLSALSSWMDEYKDNLSDFSDYSQSGKIYTGTEFIAVLLHLDITMESYQHLKMCFRKVTEEEMSDENILRVNSVIKMVLTDIFIVYDFLFKDNMKHKDDYRVALVKKQVWRKNTKSIDGWFSKQSGSDFEYSMNFWCLNPAVAFNLVSDDAYSIIVTSGTLSPLVSFQSELGTTFKIALEANHVIDPNQVFVGTIGHGPRGNPLKVSYENTESWDFQDELGDLVLNVCQTVPGGILCFLPSYSLLNKLHDRWQSTGVWDEITKIKEAMREQRKAEDFEKDMTQFYTTIKNVQMEGAGVVTGVFLMAVFRGKVSEGLDFTDDNARAVIAVGIPFPNIKDIQVDLKKKYNNALHESRKLLSGREWYTIQAYRALNQALGRCIRHRYDWGALLLVDIRYQQGGLTRGQQDNYYTRGLSKWVKKMITHHRNFSVAINGLKEFVKNMTTNPPQPPKMVDEVLFSTSPESAVEKKSSSTRENDMYSHEIADPPQIGRIEENSVRKYLITSSQTCEGMKETISYDEKECIAAQSKSSSNQKKPEQKCGSASWESSKENDGMLSQTMKRPLTVVDYQDLQDFNLALSPSSFQAVPPPPRRKQPKKEKTIEYVDI